MKKPRDKCFSWEMVVVIIIRTDISTDFAVRVIQRDRSHDAIAKVSGFQRDTIRPQLATWAGGTWTRMIRRTENQECAGRVMCRDPNSMFVRRSIVGDMITCWVGWLGYE